MADRIPKSTAGKMMLILGPQALSFGPENCLEIASTLLVVGEYRWILETLLKLPRWLKSVTIECSRYQEGCGLASLNDLNAWLKGTSQETLSSARNSTYASCNNNAVNSILNMPQTGDP